MMSGALAGPHCLHIQLPLASGLLLAEHLLVLPMATLVLGVQLHLHLVLALDGVQVLLEDALLEFLDYRGRLDMNVRVKLTSRADKRVYWPGVYRVDCVGRDTGQAGCKEQGEHPPIMPWLTAAGGCHSARDRGINTWSKGSCTLIALQLRYPRQGAPGSRITPIRP
jgi:hypothetical protein